MGRGKKTKKRGQFGTLFYLPSSQNKILNNVYLNLTVTATKYEKLKNTICIHPLLQHSLKIAAYFNYSYLIGTKLQ